MRVFLVWKRRCADVRAGTQAPPLRFRLGGLRVNVEWYLGRLRVEQLVSLGQIVCKWSFYLCGIAWKNITERGRGGACVPARVALQGRIHRSFPHIMPCIFGMEPPLHGRSGGHTGTAQTCWEWNVPAGLIVHQGADVLAVHHAFEVAIDVHVEHIDRQVVFLAHGGGGEVHHF